MGVSTICLSWTWQFIKNIYIYTYTYSRNRKRTDCAARQCAAVLSIQQPVVDSSSCIVRFYIFSVRCESSTQRKERSSRSLLGSWWKPEDRKKVEAIVCPRVIGDEQQKSDSFSLSLFLSSHLFSLDPSPIHFPPSETCAPGWMQWVFEQCNFLTCFWQGNLRYENWSEIWVYSMG